MTAGAFSRVYSEMMGDVRATHRRFEAIYWLSWAEAYFPVVWRERYEQPERVRSYIEAIRHYRATVDPRGRR